MGSHLDLACDGRRGVDLRPPSILAAPGAVWVQGRGSQTPICSCSARGSLGPGAVMPGRDKGFEVNTDPPSVDCGPASSSGTGTTVAASQGQL